MYDFVEGQVISRCPTEAVLAAGGVGYRLTIPLSTYDALPPHGHARLFVHLHVREDELRLYGFATHDERRLFTRLIAISGIGPGTAVALLNGISVDDFRRAAANEQRDIICRVKGIGRKTADRIILELKDEMARELAETPAAGAPLSPRTSDAVAALLVLGYTRSASENAVARALTHLGRAAPLEDIIRKALEKP